MVRRLNIMKDEQGFSLVELLVVLLIVTMITMLLSSGIPVAVNAYQSVMDSSNAQVLLSTTTSLLRSELGRAVDITLSDDGTLRFIDSRTNDVILLNGSSATSGFTLTYEDPDLVFLETGTSSRPLVSEKMATNGLIVQCDSPEISPDNKVVTFKNLRVTKPGRTSPLTTLSEFKVRSIVSS